MARTEFVWVEPPAKLRAAIEAYGERAIVATRALADMLAVMLQNEMRLGAPWSDRTGNARSGLYTVTDVASDIVTIYLSHGHTIHYGLFLETARGGKYAIIGPTIERNLGRIRAELERLFE